MRPLAAEALGTFALVFAGTGAIVVDKATSGAIGHAGVAITFGLVATAMIYTFGDVSGAHFNPALTIGLAIAKRCSWSSVVPYTMAQFAGAFVASGLLRLSFTDSETLGETLPRGSPVQSLVLEFVSTFVLTLVLLGSTTGSRRKTAMAGISIGATIAFVSMFAGPISGASMNPARSLAPAVIGDSSHVWIYLVGPLGGAALGAATYRFLFESQPDDISTEDAV